MRRSITCSLCVFFSLSSALSYGQGTPQGSDQLQADWCRSCYGEVEERGPIDKNGKKHGEWAGHYKKSGSLALKGSYAQGKRVGTWTFYLPKDRVEEGSGLVLQGSYKDGVKVGTWSLWGSDGSRAQNRVYSKKGTSRLVTKWRRITPGEIESLYREDLIAVKTGKRRAQKWMIHGPFKSMMNGRVIEKSTYKKGKYHGLRQQWGLMAEGLRETGKFKNGQKVGVHRSYYPDSGLKHCVSIFKKSTGTTRCFHRSGKPSQLTHLHVATQASHPSNTLDGWVRHGAYKQWHDNGKLELEAQFEHGEQVGAFTSWYSDGTLQQKGQWALYPASSKNLSRKTGYKYGPWQEFAPNGQLIRKGKYDKGNKVGQWYVWTPRGEKEAIEVYDGKPYSKPVVKPWN